MSRPYSEELAPTVATVILATERIRGTLEGSERFTVAATGKRVGSPDPCACGKRRDGWPIPCAVAGHGHTLRIVRLSDT